MTDTASVLDPAAAPAPSPMPIPNGRLLDVGDPMPWVVTSILGGTNRFGFDRMGGKHTLLLFFGSAAWEACAGAIKLVESHASMFDFKRAAFFGVTIDPSDQQSGRLASRAKNIHFFLDYDKELSTRLGAANAAADGRTSYTPHWLLIDPALQVIGRFPLDRGADALAATARAIAQPLAGGDAPVLVVPHVLEPDFCRRLVELYEARGGTESGFMREVGGKTVPMHDHNHKRRADYEIQEQDVRRELRIRLERRLVPMIERAYHFKATRIERYIVACYDAKDGGHFAAHRDNTTPGTAHRRFAVTINLNDDFEGGNLRFPEYGERTYRAPVGGAVVFSCSLLHEAQRVTSGCRYATLPFLYDEAAASIREANRGSLVTGA